jgi:hypothetical protein
MLIAAPNIAGRYRNPNCVSINARAKQKADPPAASHAIAGIAIRRRRYGSIGGVGR